MQVKTRSTKADVVLSLILKIQVPLRIPKEIHETLSGKDWETIAQLQSYIEDICQPDQIDMILEARQRGFYSLIEEVFSDVHHKKVRPVVEKMLNALKGSPLFGKLSTMPNLRKMV